MSEREPVGSIADEAAKLFAAASTWAQDHPAVCGFCPFCQLVAALRGERPDLGAKLTQAVEIAGDAARAAAQLFAVSAAEPPPPPEEPSVRVQIIDIA